MFASTALSVVLAPPCAVPVAEASAAVRRSTTAMGAPLHLEVTAGDRRTALVASEAALAAIDRAEQRLSTWRSDSELAALNGAAAGEWVALSGDLRRDLGAAFEWARRTGGAFDPVIGSLIEAWDLRGRGAVPEAERLLAARAATGFELVELAGGKARRIAPGAWVDEGAFGKGVGLADAVAAATAAGAGCVLLDFGGQLILTEACGEVEIGIADPRDRTAVIATLWMTGGSVATSGNSVRRLATGTGSVGHLLDPRSGHPAPDWGAVTVLASDPVDADCLATALFVMGPDAGLQWAATERVAAVFAILDGLGGIELRCTPGAAAALRTEPGSMP